MGFPDPEVSARAECFLRTESVVYVKQILHSFTGGQYTCDLDFQLNEIH